jgi:large subunit ribosomal protein L4
MELIVYKINGEQSGRSVQLNEEIFGIEPNDHAIYLDVKLIQANKRQGTHSSKERSQISGSTRKLKKQKGTGTARLGDGNSPLLRGGGRVFGPKPRDYSFKLNKKVKRLARMSALAYKAKDNQILVVEDFTFEAPKTKKYIDLLKHFDLYEKRSLLILPNVDNNVVLSSRNVQKAMVTTASLINTYDLLSASKLIIAESTLGEIEKIFAQ